jgi:hypothetical protein
MYIFKVSATVDDPDVIGDAKFQYSIVDNDNFTVDNEGRVEAISGYTPKIGEKVTVEVSYKCRKGYISKSRKTFTIKL